MGVLITILWFWTSAHKSNFLSMSRNKKWSWKWPPWCLCVPFWWKNYWKIYQIFLNGSFCSIFHGSQQKSWNRNSSGCNPTIEPPLGLSVLDATSKKSQNRTSRGSFWVGKREEKINFFSRISERKLPRNGKFFCKSAPKC